MKLDLNQKESMLLLSILIDIYERNIVRLELTRNIVKIDLLTTQNKFIENLLKKKDI
jgi:hypothetical protein